MFPWEQSNFEKPTYHRVTRYEVEQNLQRQRQRENDLGDYGNYTKGDGNIRVANEIERNADTRRRRNNYEAMVNELAYDDMLRNQRIESRDRQRMFEQEKLLADELTRMKCMDQEKQRNIQRICEEDEELRELQDKLKTAYINKERAYQIKEKDFNSLQERQKEYELFLEAENKRRLELLKENELEEQKRQQRIEGKQLIEQQIHNKEVLRKEEAARVAAQEKAEIDSIVNNILEQDKQARRDHFTRQRKLKEFMDKYLKENEDYKNKMKLEEQKENDKLLRVQEEMDERDRLLESKKQQIKAQRDQLFEKLTSQVKEKMREEEELQNYKELLYYEEEHRRMEELDRQNEIRKQQMKEDMMRANSQMQREKGLKLQKEKDEEMRLAEMMRAKFEADLLKEKQEFERLQQEKLTYRSHLGDQIKQRQELYRMELERELFEKEQEKKREEFRRNVIAEARRRLLEEHAKPLNQYLPKGVPRNMEEYNIIHSK